MGGKQKLAVSANGCYWRSLRGKRKRESLSFQVCSWGQEAGKNENDRTVFCVKLFCKFKDFVFLDVTHALHFLVGVLG